MSTTPSAGGNNASTIHLVEMMGGDLAVVNSARVSYGKSSNELTDADVGLINRLLRDKHGTPFEQAVFTFYVRCPIFVAREWMRHRVGSFNEVSGRYKKLDTEFYTPKKFRMKNPATTKAMDYQYVNVPDDVDAAAKETVQNLYAYATQCYEALLEMGVANELARLVLPVAIFTEFRWTVNARALMNFLALRNADPAMFEIRLYAMSIEKLFHDAMPATHKAFIQNDRVAP